jgi:hypothetical protein
LSKINNLELLHGADGGMGGFGVVMEAMERWFMGMRQVVRLFCDRLAVRYLSCSFQ